MLIDYNLLIDNYGNFEINLIKDNNDIIPITLPLSESIKLFTEDTSQNYLSSNNYDFLKDTSLIKDFNNNDIFLRPTNTLFRNYDIIIGSKNLETPLEYNIYSRNYFYMLNESVEITLCPPNNYKFLHIIKDYENLKFYSKINMNNVEKCYKNDFNKIKFLNIILEKDEILHIPPYWFYSIKFLSEKSLIANFKYKTFMNMIAITPELCKQFLQNNNIKINMTKVIDGTIKQ